jgi:hypothetical protein
MIGRLLSMLAVAVFVAHSQLAIAKTEIDEAGATWKNGIGPYFEVSFVLVKSTSSYADAHRFAQGASADLGIRLDLRGLVHDPTHGLTWPQERCAKDPVYPFPCYVARGRWDPGRYISIERSDAYSSFKPDLFIVVAASGDPAEMRSVLASIKAKVPDAYMKTEVVYFGCMH